MNIKEYHIIGMSPGNSYFTDELVKNLLKKTVEQFGKVAVLIPDIPAISTYIALGYPENRARRDKAIPKGNALKNRTQKAMTELGYGAHQVRIIDWENEVENNISYQGRYEKIRNLYEQNPEFHTVTNNASQAVIENSSKEPKSIEQASKVAAHYLLSELAFLEFAPSFLDAEKVTYIYHKNWAVYEDYIAGKFDKIIKPHLGFLLIKNSE